MLALIGYSAVTNQPFAMTSLPEAGHETVQLQREAQGLTKADLARKAGTTVSTIEAIERGIAPDPVLRATLAAALHVSEAELA